MSQGEPVEVIIAKGHVPDVPDERDHILNVASLKAVDTKTTSFTIFDNTGPGYQKAVFNQFAAGTCTCNAVAAAYMYELQRQKVPIKEYRPSRLFLYYVARYARLYDKDVKPEDIPSADYYKGLANSVPTVPLLEDSGTQMRDVIKNMGALGAPPEFEIFFPTDYAKYRLGFATWPYDRFAEPVENKFSDQDWPAEAPDSSCYKKETLHTVLNYSRPALTADAWIKEGYPVMFGFKWFKQSMDAFAAAPESYNFVAPVPKMANETSRWWARRACGWVERQG